MGKGDHMATSRTGVKKNGVPRAHFNPAPEAVWSRLLWPSETHRQPMAVSIKEDSGGINTSAAKMHAFPCDGHCTQHQCIFSCDLPPAPNHSGLVFIIPTLQLRNSSLSRKIK